MKSDIYTSLVIADDDEDIDGPITEIVVTQECNIFAVWECVADQMPKMVKWFFDHERGPAIEYAVDFARELRLKLTKPAKAGG